MRNQFIFSLALIIILGSCTENPDDSGDMTSGMIDSVAMDRYMTTLSADEFLGRKPFTEGETKTLAYLQEQYELIGLEPVVGESYLQPVPLVEITPDPNPTMYVRGGDTDLELKIREDYVAYTQRVQDVTAIEGSELVFCGFGVVAPEYNWNDYEGVDMTGKTAVVLVNDPGFESGDSTFFKGNTMTYYGRWTYKYEEAARQGAEAILIVHDTRPAGYGWPVVSNSWMGAKLDLQKENDNLDKCVLQGWLTLTAAARIFNAAGVRDWIEKAKQPGFQPIPLNLNVSTSVRNSFKKDISYNVAGMIRGSERPEEYIIYSAHWDHLGVSSPVRGDSIYNGALDNASGTASIMTIAKAFADSETSPRRSLVFIALTAEEQGLLGSAHYGSSPLFPPEQTVANLNLDAMNKYGLMKALIVTGHGHSEMDELAAEVAQVQGRYIVPDPEPEKGYYFRSDHFNFAKIGVPALYAKGGYEHWTEGREYASQKSDEYRMNDYHMPSDEYGPNFRLDGMIQDAEFFYMVGRRLANSEDWPEWKAGSEFKAIREASLKD